MRARAHTHVTCTHTGKLICQLDSKLITHVHTRAFLSHVFSHSLSLSLLRARAHIHARTDAHKHAHTHGFSHENSLIFSLSRTRVRARAHTHTHTHTHTHKRDLPFTRLVQPRPARSTSELTGAGQETLSPSRPCSSHFNFWAVLITLYRACEDLGHSHSARNPPLHHIFLSLSRTSRRRNAKRIYRSRTEWGFRSWLADPWVFDFASAVFVFFLYVQEYDSHIPYCMSAWSKYIHSSFQSPSLSSDFCLVLSLFLQVLLYL